MRAVAGTPFGLRWLLALADAVRKNKVELTDVIDGVGEEHYPLSPEDARKAFLQAASRAKRAQTEIIRKEGSIANSRTGEETRERLRATMTEIRGFVDEAEPPAAPSAAEREEHDESVAERLRGLVDHFEEEHPVLARSLANLITGLNNAGF